MHDRLKDVVLINGVVDCNGEISRDDLLFRELGRVVRLIGVSTLLSSLNPDRSS